MPRYFIEVAYTGTGFGGFQKQENTNTIQGEIEKALSTYFREQFELTGSSRTDAGVNALQNYFHFDSEHFDNKKIKSALYNLNSILPLPIVVKNIWAMPEGAHCRFDAISRTYEYIICQVKDPYVSDRSYFYPYELDQELLNLAAAEIIKNKSFEAFSKKNTQVQTFMCSISESQWVFKEGLLIYRVTANRFLRGMVKGLVGTMLKVGRNKIDIAAFKSILGSAEQSLVDFSVPSHALTLLFVKYNYNFQ
ncbi:MAG: tRNA pseudouridine synthase A [Ferruginibacter sp.]